MGRIIKLFAAVMMFAALGASVGAVAASAITSGGRVYETGDLCVTIYDQFEAGNGGGKVDASLESDHYTIGAFGFGINCAFAFDRPPGYIAMHAYNWVWGPYANQWQLCDDTGWFYNGDNVSYTTYSRGYGIHAPCGDGYYSSGWQGYVWNNGAWSGGYTNPGYIFLWYWN